MTRLELTPEQKVKLLEMCNYFYPEYSEEKCIIQMERDYFDGETGCIQFLKNNKNYDLGKNPPRLFEIVIHWFEFCILHLATIFWNNHPNIREKYGTITMFRGVLCQNVDNPVDYLYEQFKKR